MRATDSSASRTSTVSSGSSLTRRLAGSLASLASGSATVSSSVASSTVRLTTS